MRNTGTVENPASVHIKTLSGSLSGSPTENVVTPAHARAHG